MGDRDSFSLGYKGKRESNNNEDDKALKSHKYKSKNMSAFVEDYVIV